MTAGMEVKMYRQSDKITAIYCRIDYPGLPEHIHIQRECALAYAKLVTALSEVTERRRD